MKNNDAMPRFFLWTACLLLAAGCTGTKKTPSQDIVDSLKLKDYEPV